jgi:hypothetical protein
MKGHLMIEAVNETLAPYFYEQMRIRRMIARGEWDEVREPSMASFYEEVLSACVTFDDYWQREQDRAFYNMTTSCIRELRRQSMMELS